MSEEKKNEQLQNCFDGLQTLNNVLDKLLADGELHQDDVILKTKEEVEQHIEKLSSMLDTTNDEKKYNK